nr:A disintegrin and metalloproteinase with thrombospondin motifs 3-like isoform X1 [Pelodiscus sinensis]|eukprot:XP_025041606.1 A disintegrin and metalloproteinase with thrombospondin motifs 3-like isoform X1 [Pelodiscus sinensis]
MCDGIFIFNPPSWIADEWEYCTKTCGSSGYQIRTVRCIQPLHDGTNRSTHIKYCSGDRPESRRPCNRTPCPAPWKAGPWAECSVTCGEGTESRQVTCRAGDHCDGEKPESVRVCKLAPCNVTMKQIKCEKENFYRENQQKDTTTYILNKKWLSSWCRINLNNKIKGLHEPCLGDKSIFCQMEVLARYCSIPGYNKLCCESCSKRSSTLPPPYLSEAAETKEEVAWPMPTSLVPQHAEVAEESRSSVGRRPLTEEDVDVLVSTSTSKSKGAELPQKRVYRAGSQTSRLVTMPYQSAAKTGVLNPRNASVLAAIVPLAAVNNTSAGALSPVRTSRKNEKHVEKRRALRRPPVER